MKQRLDRGEDVFILDVRNPRGDSRFAASPAARSFRCRSCRSDSGELDPDREIVVHCKSGMRSAKAVAFLREQGFTKVRNLKGGILAWAAKIDKSMPTY